MFNLGSVKTTLRRVQQRANKRLHRRVINRQLPKGQLNRQHTGRRNRHISILHGLPNVAHGTNTNTVSTNLHLGPIRYQGLTNLTNTYDRTRTLLVNNRNLTDRFRRFLVNTPHRMNVNSINSRTRFNTTPHLFHYRMVRRYLLTRTTRTTRGVRLMYASARHHQVHQVGRHIVDTHRTNQSTLTFTHTNHKGNKRRINTLSPMLHLGHLRVRHNSARVTIVRRNFNGRLLRSTVARRRLPVRHHYHS